MENTYKDNCQTFIVPECIVTDNEPKLKILKSCEVLIDFRTCLYPPPKCYDDIKSSCYIDIKIDKVCGCKVLLGGVLHKKISYIYEDCCKNPHKETKEKTIPFSCYIDFDRLTLDDNFKISGHEVVCQFSEVQKIKENCSIKTVFIEKDIIKIAVQMN